jgi:MoxR-like ATPase
MRWPAADRPLTVSDLVGRFKEDHRHADSFGWHRWGACGIGKSRIVAEVADDIGYEFLDVRAVQLVLDRRLSEYLLPDRWVVIAAGNPASERGVPFSMPRPLRNRFVDLHFEANFGD